MSASDDAIKRLDTSLSISAANIAAGDAETGDVLTFDGDEYAPAAPASGEVAWGDVTGKPSTFTPSSHTHVQADIADLDIAWGDVTGKPSTFTPSSHTHVQADITDLSASKAVIAKPKTARQTVTASTTYQDDDVFQFAAEANKSYVIEGVLFVSAPSSGGFRCGFVLPTGGTRSVTTSTNATGYTVVDDTAVYPIVSSNTLNITTGLNHLRLVAYITIDSTPGNIVFQWAQGTGHGTGTYIERTSIMTLTEV